MKSRFAKLSRRFYLQPTLSVAKQLVGKFLIKKLDDEILIGKIVEVEAYLGEKDPASHAYREKTRRNEVMFQTGGHLYVYFTYGMHFCCNVVTEEEGIGRAVLLRAVEPIEGLETMALNRGMNLHSERDRRNLCSGPAKLCEAFAIARESNGSDLCGNQIWLANEPISNARGSIMRSTRVGIREGVEHRWRFFLRDNPHVSMGKPS